MIESGRSRYALAFVAVLCAVTLRQLLVPVLGTNAAPYVTFYVAVIVVSVFAGRGPAVATMVVGALAAVFFFVEPRYVLILPSAAQAVWLGFYLLVTGSIVVAIDSQQRAAALARARLRELEAEQARRAAAEKDTERERRWAAQTLASIGDAVITTDLRGQITFLNRVASELTGWNSEEALGQPIEKVFHIVNEQTGAVAESPVARVLREGVVVELANHTALVQKNGDQISIDDSGAPIRDPDGEICGAVLIFRDFTERRRSEEANARLAAIVRYSDEAILSKSLDGIIQSWNGGAERLFGYTAEEAIGKHISFLIPPERAHEESGLIESIRLGRTIERWESIRRRKDGTDVQVSMTLSPLYDTYGEVCGVSHIARDIGSQKELQAQLLQIQKLESLGVLAGGVAHDFNNLLTGIIGSASLLSEIVPPGTTEASLAAQITTAGDRAAHLTRQLLAYSGKGRFLVERIDVASSVREIIELVRAAIPRTTELLLDLAEDLPRVEADAAQFQQLIMNLVINAAEALEIPGKVTVRTGLKQITAAEVSCTPEYSELDPGVYIALEVADTGCGMTAATKARIFEPFFTTKFAGRGLGLAAVQGIVRGHEGAIRVVSAPREGSTFTVLLPPAAERFVPEFQSADSKPVILVVDDEELVRETARITLERAGFAVLTAPNGQEGLELLQKNKTPISLVLLDLTMPVMSGRVALEAMRRLCPGLPVLICSGYNEQDALRHFDHDAVAGFIKKPFTAQILKRKVLAVLGRLTAEQEG